MRSIGVLLITFIMTVAIALFPLASGVSASHNEAENYQYIIGEGILCGLDPSACPAISMARNGDKVELTGSGTINTVEKIATGGGTFIHKDQDGNVVGSGTWTAVRLVSFRSYGSGLAQGLPAEFEGGRAKMKIILTAAGGPTFEANLKVDCTLGDKISPVAEEGVELIIRGAPNFKDIVSGFTLFIRQP